MFPFVVSHASEEYATAMKTIMQEVQKHKDSLIPGKPQLNMCDEAVMVSFNKFLVYLITVYVALIRLVLQNNFQKFILPMVPYEIGLSK